MTSNRGHGRPTQETPLTPDDTKAPSHAERARTLVEAQRTGTLATLTEEGFPYASYVTFALHEGEPVYLISRMAAHTKNLEGDERASLMVHEHGADDPLANGRVTLVGRCRKLAEPTAARAAFLAVHPQAEYYADFTDFGFWQLSVESIRYIGGYGRMSWVEAGDWRTASADPISAAANGIVEHMNDDHADALVAYARAFTRATEASEVTMSGIDRYGFEMSVQTERGPRPARIAFDEPIETATDARRVLIELLKKARAQLNAADA